MSHRRSSVDLSAGVAPPRSRRSSVDYTAAGVGQITRRASVDFSSGVGTLGLPLRPSVDSSFHGVGTSSRRPSVDYSTAGEEGVSLVKVAFLAFVQFYSYMACPVNNVQSYRDGSDAYWLLNLRNTKVMRLGPVQPGLDTLPKEFPHT